MEKSTIGLFIKQLMKEKKISVAEMATRLGLTRQGIYDFLNRKDSAKLSEIKKYADVLGVEAQFIIDNYEQNNLTNILQNRSDDVFAKGDAYLMKYIAELEERVREQSKTISVLLGKSKGVIDGLVFAENPFFGVFSERYGYTPTK